MSTWTRRAVTLPSLVFLTVTWLALFPFTLPLAAGVDLVRGGPWPLARCTVYLTLYLLCEVAGVVAAFAVWLASGVWAGGDRARFLRWNVVLQTRWATVLYRGAERVFALRTEVEGAEVLTPGPLLVFIRHVSTADTLLPVVYVTGAHGIALRFVLKRELLWDPCLDIVGLRLPNAFVQRGSGESEREVASVQMLVDGLGPSEGVLIYPEGTRFTPTKRVRVLAKLATHADRATLARAEQLTHVLPPHPGGPLGLLQRNTTADAIFCAHTGLEGAGSPWDLVAGALVGSTVRLKFWRVARADIPVASEARLAWLFDEWTKIDGWIAAHSPPSG